MSEDSYTTASYGVMMCDRGRIDPYLAALKKVIVPGETVVLELGTGTGVVAFAAIQAGARKVYAVEPNSAIEVAREIARINGVDGIEFIQDMSTNIDLPPADVLISDLRGVLPLHEMHIPSIVDARQRLLKPGAAQIARQDTLFLALAEAPVEWRDTVGYWDENLVGLDMSPAKRVTSNSFVHCAVKPEQLLSAPQPFFEIDYQTVTSPHVSAAVHVDVTRDGTVHGLSMWFDTTLDDEISLSNAPGLPMLAYGRPIFLLNDPLELRRGERLEITISARLVRHQYIWSWSGKVVGDASRTFEQSSFHSADISLRMLERVRLDARPERTNEAERVRFVLERMDGAYTVEQLAEELRTMEAGLDWHEAVVSVSDLVARFGKPA